MWNKTDLTVFTFTLLLLCSTLLGTNAWAADSAGEPDFSLLHPYKFTEPEYLTGMSTRLLAQSGATPAGGAASAPTAPGGSGGSQHDSLSDVGAKLSNPASNIWALFTEFDLTFSDGDVNLGDPKVGGNMLFQPIMPIPLFGTGTNQWKLIMRPTIPFIFSTALPKGLNRYDRITGWWPSSSPSTTGGSARVAIRRTSPTRAI